MIHAALGIILAVLSLLPMMASPARAIMMTFDGAPSGSLIGESPGDITTYAENGILMSLVRNHYDILGGMVQIDTYGSGYGELRFEMLDGSIFDLNRLFVFTDNYLTKMDPTEPVVVEYRLSFSDGSSILVDSGIASTVEVEKSGISYFTYAVNCTGFTTLQFNTRLDNIDVSAVPEPSAILLLGSGLLGLVGLRRSRPRP